MGLEGLYLCAGEPGFLTLLCVRRWVYSLTCMCTEMGLEVGAFRVDLLTSLVRTLVYASLVVGAEVPPLSAW